MLADFTHPIFVDLGEQLCVIGDDHSWFKAEHIPHSADPCSDFTGTKIDAVYSAWFLLRSTVAEIGVYYSPLFSWEVPGKERRRCPFNE